MSGLFLFIIIAEGSKTMQPTLSLEEIAAANQALEGAYPQQVLRWAVETFGDKLAIVTSFQPTGIVTLHMLKEITPNLNVFTLDTGLLFPETLRLMDELELLLDIQVNRVKPDLTLAQQARHYGSNLWEKDPDRCCHIRKTVPLKQALDGYGAWITGLRRDQSEGRSETPIVSWDARNGMVKISPLATWTEQMIWTYIEAYELPYNSLHDRGYPTIGCYTCTHAVAEGQDSRAGRWVGSAKTECGIHVKLIEDEQVKAS
jgi:phosphoadenosine phosphosulfate reductase